MRSRLVASFVAIVMIATIIPLVLFEGTEDAEAQDTGPMILNEIGLYMRESMELSPLPPEIGTENQATAIPNGFVRNGLFGYYILPWGNLYWMDVGMWSTQPLKQTINLGGRVDITVFATREEGSGAVTSDFRFYILRGQEQLLMIETHNHRIADDGTFTRIEANDWFPANNDTTIEAGTQVSIMIQARCQNGATLMFGSPDVPSGFRFGSNALEIMNLFMDKEKVTVEYKDAFMVPWIDLFMELKVDNEILNNQEMNSEINSMNRTREISWERESPPKSYEIFISMSYHYSGDYNISDTRVLKVEEIKVSGFQSFKNFMGKWWLLFFFLLLGLISLILYGKHRQKLWKRRFKTLPVSIQELTEHKKKKAWKKSDKESRKIEREKRRIQKEEEEKEEEDEEFSLFKKKQKREPRRKPSVSFNLSSDTADELEL